MGKSELAKTLATYYFGSVDAMVRFDMSEYMERHTVSKLIGSPPGAVLPVTALSRQPATSHVLRLQPGYSIISALRSLI